MRQQPGFVVIIGIIAAVILLLAATGAIYFYYQATEPTVPQAEAEASGSQDIMRVDNPEPLGEAEQELDAVDINSSLDQVLVDLDNEAAAF
jgi:hypothetical protein